jgi:hypothetical protein
MGVGALRCVLDIGVLLTSAADVSGSPQDQGGVARSLPAARTRETSPAGDQMRSSDSPSSNAAARSTTWRRRLRATDRSRSKALRASTSPDAMR